MKKILISFFVFVCMFSVSGIVHATGPVLISAEPNNAYIGSSVTINGSDFGSTDPGSMYQFYLNGKHINRGYIDSWTNNSFKLLIPSKIGDVNDFGSGDVALTPGNYELQIIYNLNYTTTEKGFSNKINLTILDSCTQDKWECGDWSACSAYGSQTRTCNKTFECPSINTPSPSVSQSCTPPSQPTPIIPTIPSPVYQQPQTPQTNSQNNSVLKAAVRIEVLDTLSNNETQGTGINIGTEFLTNYHVIKDAIANPSRYIIRACVTISINDNPDCRLQLSLTQNFGGSSLGNPKYDKTVDLALLYIDKVYSGGVWKSWMNTSPNEWGVSTVNIANYIKNYQDLAVGDQVYSIGYPDYGNGKTIQAEGVVKELWKDPKSGQLYILNSIDISHGNSGGPVFNSKGELVGVSAACLTASLDTNKCKTYSGLFIPLPTLNWWYMNVTNSRISTFNGSSSYVPNNGISDEVMNEALCTAPLRQNAHYDQTKNGCSCNTGFSENGNGDCVDSSGYVDPTLRYGQKIDPSGEKNALGILDQTISNGKGESSIGGNAQPIIITPKSEAEIITPVIKKAPEIKADTTNSSNLTSTNSDTKVVTNTEPVKPKSFWAKFLGWLGF